MVTNRKDNRRLGVIGDALRSAREERDLTLEKASEGTRIAPQFLQALENETFEALPAPVYVRGFLRSYATYLGLDTEPLLQALVEGGTLPPASAAPDAFVAGPGAPGPRTTPSADPFQAPPPPQPRGVVPMEEQEFVRYEPGGRASSAGPPGARRAPGGSYGTSPVPGVLMERAGRYNDGSIPRGFAFVALGLILVVVLAFAAFVLATGGDEDQAGLPANPEASVTPTVAETIISLESATTEASGTGADPGATADATSDATTDAAATASGDTPVAGATASATTAPGATVATATNTPDPTETPVPTATPTPANTPTPTATPIPTPVPPGRFQECESSGNTIECGELPWRVVCVRPEAPGISAVYFIDVDRDYAPLPAGWTAQDVSPKGAADDPDRNGCSA